MSKELISEISKMKNLFGYKRGVVISEQFVPFDPQGNYPSLGIGNQSNLTQKQKDAMAAGYGPVTDEAAKRLPVGPDGKIVPKATEPSTQTVDNTKKASPSAAASSTGAKTNQSKQPASTQGSNYLRPAELIQNVGNKTGVQAFQDWLDKTYSGWHSKYKTLSGDALKGYGKFGPNTSAAWTKYKTEYLKQNPNLSQEAKKTTSTTQADATTQTQQPGVAPQTAQPETSLTSGKRLANATPKNTNLSLAASTTPEQYYKTLYDSGLIQGDPEGEGRIRYRGPELNQEQQNLLTTAMDKMGYEFVRKGNDKRLVYRKK
jgi:hypothetical protein